MNTKTYLFFKVNISWSHLGTYCHEHWAPSSILDSARNELNLWWTHQYLIFNNFESLCFRSSLAQWLRAAAAVRRIISWDLPDLESNPGFGILPLLLLTPTLWNHNKPFFNFFALLVMKQTVMNLYNMQVYNESLFIQCISILSSASLKNILRFI